MVDAEHRLSAALRIIEDYPNLHMGPTVSFVFGALQQPIGVAPESAAVGREKLRRLLTALRTAPPGRGVRVQGCGNIRAYVASSRPFVDGLPGTFRAAIPTIFEKLVDALWQLYGSFIMAGEQSIDDFVWHRVTTDEIRTIEELVDAADEPAQRK